MNKALSLIAGAVLAGLDLWGLRWFASSLGKKSSNLARLLLVVFLLGKFGALAGAILVLKTQLWFEVWGFAAGLGIPFAGFFVLEAGKKNVKPS